MKMNWVQRFSPAWFAAVMGTGGLANVLFSWGSAMRWSAIVGAWLASINVVFLVVFLVPWLTRWLVHPMDARRDLDHPILGNFFVTLRSRHDRCQHRGAYGPCRSWRAGTLRAGSDRLVGRSCRRWHSEHLRWLQPTSCRPDSATLHESILAHHACGRHRHAAHRQSPGGHDASAALVLGQDCASDQPLFLRHGHRSFSLHGEHRLQSPDAARIATSRCRPHVLDYIGTGGGRDYRLDGIG